MQSSDRDDLGNLNNSQVDELLSQVSDQSYLELKIGSHVNSGVASGISNFRSASGLDSDLAYRLAKLKEGRSGKERLVTKDVIKRQHATGDAPVVPGHSSVEDFDIIGADLAVRLQALKKPSSPVQVSSSDSSKAKVPSKDTDEERAYSGTSFEMEQVEKDAEIFTAPSTSQLGVNGISRDIHLPEDEQRRLEVDILPSLESRTSHTYILEGDESTQRTRRSANSRSISEDAEVNELLGSMQEELRLERQAFRSFSIVSGSGYINDNEQDSGSELSDSFLERETNRVVDWARDSITLSDDFGQIQFKQGSDEPDIEVRVKRGNLGKQLQLGRENLDETEPGYQPDDEGSKRGNLTGKKRK